MTAHSFGNRWVGHEALHEPPVAPTVQEIAQRNAESYRAERLASLAERRAAVQPVSSREERMRAVEERQERAKRRR
jgi:hypothetical protein